MSELAINSTPATGYRGSKPLNKRRVTPAIKRALHLMVWDFKTDNEAAVTVGISIHHLRLSLKEPHVRAYYRGQLEVLRARESSRNVHALIEVRDQKTNHMARVQAVKALEQLDDDEGHGKRANALPGLQIVIVQPSGSPQPMVDVTPRTLPHE